MSRPRPIQFGPVLVVFNTGSIVVSRSDRDPR